MNAVDSMLEAGVRHAREGGVGLPEAVLARCTQAIGAASGALGQGSTILARLGLAGATGRRWDLPAGRDSFWFEAVGGIEPSSSLRTAAGFVLSSWMVREELKRTRFSERRRLWEVESLRAISEALGGTLDPARIAEELLVHATALLDARRGEVWLAAGDGAASAAQISGAGQIGICADGSCVVAARVAGEVLDHDEVVALPDQGLLEAGRLAVPVVGRRGRLGVLALAEREVRGGTTPFVPTDMETLTLFASQAAIALESASLHREAIDRERLERELEVAAVVQREIMPKQLPLVAGYELAARAAASRRVGGDVYDLVVTPRGLFVLLGDVAGKGVPAALMAASLQAAVRVLMQGFPTVEEMARQLHRHFFTTTPDNKFATVFFGYLSDGGDLRYVSAGHNPVVVVGKDGRTSLLGAGGPPLGLLPVVDYREQRACLAPGDVLIAYTDGLSEAPSAADEDFGVERIREFAIAQRFAPVATIIDRLFAAVDAYTGGAPAHDDRTVVALRRLER